MSPLSVPPSPSPFSSLPLKLCFPSSLSSMSPLSQPASVARPALPAAAASRVTALKTNDRQISELHHRGHADWVRSHNHVSLSCTNVFLLSPVANIFYEACGHLSFCVPTLPFFVPLNDATGYLPVARRPTSHFPVPHAHSILSSFRLARAPSRTRPSISDSAASATEEGDERRRGGRGRPFRRRRARARARGVPTTTTTVSLLGLAPSLAPSLTVSFLLHIWSRTRGLYL